MPAHEATQPSARERLLQAAAVVFARDGLAGATTRAIAQEAGVNEVTLFRHFQSKDRLLAAVVGDKFGQAATANQIKVPPATDDLRADLLALAGAYDSMLTANWPLVRTMLGEMHHHLNESSERQVFRAIFLPLKAALLARIETAQAAGQLQRNSRPDALADLFFGAVFYGVLRRSMPHVRIEYSVATYLESAVSMFLDGAAA
ncbi:MAG TPA: TetR/AcrR family transcriptional regulator [Lacunisphaera sp.]|nr:TetR/AcrR family transcriptional regulator [Lacunisphaera sp.]